MPCWPKRGPLLTRSLGFPYAGTQTYAQASHETSPLLTPLSRAAGFESKRVDGFECRTSGEAVFELFWSDGSLAAVS